MQQKKTVKEWIMQLPEPYKNESLEMAGRFHKLDCVYASLGDALSSFIFNDYPPKNYHWDEVFNRIEKGEFDKPSIPWPDEADWIKCPAGTFARAVDKNGECFFFSMFIPAERIFIGAWAVNTKDCGIIADMSGVDWEKSLEYRPSIFQK